MPSWVWTDVVLHASADVLAEFVSQECDATGYCIWRKSELPPNTDWRKHMYDQLGFDGFVCNEDCMFVPGIRHIMDNEYALVLQARFETRWNPPIPFFKRMVTDYSNLTIYMKVEHEDNDTYPLDYFLVQTQTPALSRSQTLPPPAPPPTRLVDEEVETVAEKVSTVTL